jgi:AraC family transcriptional regulator of adaptative response / DNA-3-methyladenine glycosylase II
VVDDGSVPVPGHYTVTRLLRGPGGPVVTNVHLSADGTDLSAVVHPATASDTAWSVERLRRWLDLDADPVAVGAALGTDPLLAGPVGARPGLRVPGTVDAFELAVRAVVGQQVSTAAARTVVGRIVVALGERGPHDLSLFPTADRLAGVPVDALRAFGLNTGRASTVGVLARAVANGLALEPGSDPAEVRDALLALPGIGPWTADYIVLRALGCSDVFPAGDLVLRYAIAQLPGGAGEPVSVREAAARAQEWSPWRAYAAQHLWSAWAARPAGDRPVRRVAPQPADVSVAERPPRR